MELTSDGHNQAELCGVQLRKLINIETVRAYRSPYFRTRQTFDGIKRGGDLNIVRDSEDPRIREQDFGHLRELQAFQLIDAERSEFGTFFYRIPDGESGADVYDRISLFLDTLWRDFAKDDYPRNALIVSHGLTLRLFCMRWFHWSVEHFERLRNPHNCAIVVLELGNDGKYHLSSVWERDQNDAYLEAADFRMYSPEETEEWRTRTATEAGAPRPWMR